MFGAHDIIVDLPSSTVQEFLTMVLELVYSDNERRIALSTSKQIWDILYKETIVPDILQTDGGEEDQTKAGTLLTTTTHMQIWKARRMLHPWRKIL